MSLIPKDDSNIYKKAHHPAHNGTYRQGRSIKPISSGLKIQNIAQVAMSKGYQKANPAVELIKKKIDRLYAEEPDVRKEMSTSLEAQKPKIRSKHQNYLYQLTTSGKSLAQIQTDWHNYYVHLPNEEKHQVWQEFYQAASRQPSTYGRFVSTRQPSSTATYDEQENAYRAASNRKLQTDTDNLSDTEQIKEELLDNVYSRSKPKLKAKHHLQSLVFGLGTGSIVIIIFLFSFFNEVIIAPLIQPSRNDQNTPIILNTADVAPSTTPQVIIPKINVQIPVVYNSSVSETDIENSLEDGVIHYPTTSLPGQLGNAAFFGHSSNNIFNPGKYKFAFVLLHTLVPGDIFYLTYNNQVYAYKVFNREVVSPSDISVLNDVPGQQATATLITCDPPGTSINRLVVWGQQISPAPSTDSQPTQNSTPTQIPTQLASDGPTLWGRFTYWIEHLF